MDNLDFVDNKEKNRYELYVEGAVATLGYRRSGEYAILLESAEVPGSLQGQGLGGILAERAFADIRKRGLRAIPICPFLIHYLRKHPEWNDIWESF